MSSTTRTAAVPTSPESPDEEPPNLPIFSQDSAHFDGEELILENQDVSAIFVCTMVVRDATFSEDSVDRARFDLDVDEGIKRIVYHHDWGNPPYHFGGAIYEPDAAFSPTEIGRFVTEDLEFIEIEADEAIEVTGYTADHEYSFRYELESLDYRSGGNQ